MESLPTDAGNQVIGPDFYLISLFVGGLLLTLGIAWARQIAREKGRSLGSIIGPLMIEVLVSPLVLIWWLCFITWFIVMLLSPFAILGLLIWAIYHYLTH